MPNRPLIVLPAPATASRARLFGRGARLHLPGKTRQGQRLGPRLDALREYFERKAVDLRSSAAAQTPEEVLVLETIGSVANFLKAVKRVDGLDFLAEWDVEDIAPDDDFYDEKRRDTRLSGRFFLVMTNQRALGQLLSLWEWHQEGRPARRGFTPFFHLFDQLRDVRRWSQKDRLLETGILEYWGECAEAGDDAVVPFETELWFRQTPRQRAESLERVRRIVSGLRGQILSVCELEPICYHAAVVTLPASEIRRLATRDEIELLGESAVMCFRPSGQTVGPGETGPDLQEPVAPLVAAVPSGETTVALLDGLPLENHARLFGRLRVDDPDDYSSVYVSRERDHGTTMASIIVHGDLNAPRSPLPRPLYVRPILRPDPQPWNSSRDERVPFGVDAIDLTHRAVRRIFEGEGASPPAAPATKIINFSIGDPKQQFHIAVSSWARLLDWLAFNYNVLFCVSAGNHSGSIELDVPRTDLATLPPRACEAEVLKALYRDLRLRRILAPSEAINSITVGAWHHDFGPVANIGSRRDPFESTDLPSPTNGLGCGFRSSTKPDLLFPGGRQLYVEKLGNTHENATLEVAHSILAPGVLAASPSRVAGQLNMEKCTRGSSNANAFATRSAAFLYEQLVSLRQDPGGDRISDEFSAVLLKAMLVHGAEWRAAYERLKSVLKADGMPEEKFRRLAARFLGFGFVEPLEELSGTDSRATMIGCGELTEDAAHDYRIPLPPSLSGVRGMRRVTVTLAWLSPVRPRHRNYRGASLWFEVENDKLSTNRRDAEWRSVRNGTLQHEVFEGMRASAFSEDETLLIRINCRADAGPLPETIRYGLVVSIEAAEELGIPIYDEVAVRIRPPVPIPAPGV